jgi:hypothetical protein
MTYPTHEEISRAYDMITRDGPGEPGERLALIILSDFRLRDTLNRMFRLTGGESPEDWEAICPVLVAAMSYGLHLGVHIGEGRSQR